MVPLTSVNDLRDVLGISQEKAEEIANALINLALSSDCCMFGVFSIDLEELSDEEKFQRMTDEEKEAASYLFCVLRLAGLVGLYLTQSNIVVIAKPESEDVFDEIQESNGELAHKMIVEGKLVPVGMVAFTRGVIQIMQKQLLLSSVAKKSRKET